MPHQTSDLVQIKNIEVLQKKCSHLSWRLVCSLGIATRRLNHIRGVLQEPNRPARNPSLNGRGAKMKLPGLHLSYQNHSSIRSNS